MAAHSLDTLQHTQEIQEQSGVLGTIVDGVAGNVAGLVAVQGMRDIFGMHASDEDCRLLLDWQKNYPQWWSENVTSGNRRFDFQTSEYGGVILIDGVKWMRDDAIESEEFGGNQTASDQAWSAEDHPYSDDILALVAFANGAPSNQAKYPLDIKGILAKANTLGATLPPVSVFQRLVARMPGETLEERCANTAKLLNLSGRYLVDNSTEGTSNIYSFMEGESGSGFIEDTVPVNARLILL